MSLPYDPANADVPPHKHSEHNHDGEPGCYTAAEIHKLFRNFWDPIAYWECSAQGKPAQSKRCPRTELFSDKVGKCVHYADWEWTEPVEPPSRPKKN